MEENIGGGNFYGLIEFIVWRIVKDKCFLVCFIYLMIKSK